MVIQDIKKLPHTPERAIIINVNTKVVTTLALLSALRYAQMPVLLIECDSRDGSFEHFDQLMDEYEFDMISAELRPHGFTLDWVFQNIDTDRILLIDSDLELLSSEPIEFFRKYISEYNVFGCGFLNGPAWLTQDTFVGTDIEGALFVERPWIPCSYFNVSIIRKAISVGKSFINIDKDNEYTSIPLLAKLREKYSIIKKILKHGPAWLRNPVCGGQRPAALCYDTGAMIFEYLKYHCLMSFVGLPESASQKYTTHYRGVTRHTLDPHNVISYQYLDIINYEVQQRLADKYDKFL